ncbi:MAG TPA: DUF2232 domain-containing protein [Thermoanaerobaculia bacterium]|nr:DUF2232 domain-containing protein [Thermoanaerobaculia bacterium]
MIETSLHQSEPVMLPGRPLGRLIRSIAGYSLMTALMIVTPLLVFVPAALFHCAIRNGRRAAWVTLVLAVALAALYVSTMSATPAAAVKMAWTYVAGVTLGIALPSMAALPLVERGEKFGRVLVFLLIGSAIGLALTELGSRALLDFSPFAAQVTQAQQTSAEFVQVYRSKGMPSEMVQLFQRWAGYSTYVLPAVMLINVSLVFILSLLMLGRLKAWRELTARRGDSDALGAFLFRNFSLPDWLLFAFLLGGLTPVASGMLQKVAANVLALTVFLYILQGLAIFRFLLVAMGAGFAGTALGWLLLMFLTITGVGPLLLGVAGLFDPFFDFRHFKKRKDDSHEGHSD